MTDRARQRGAVGIPHDFVPFGRSRTESTIVAEFEARVAAAPGHAAVRADGESSSYRDLDARANRIANGLLGRRSPRAEPVALLFAQGIASIAAILGVLKAGKFYVSLDPAAPPAENAAVIAHAGARALIGDPALMESIRPALDGGPVALLTVAALEAGSSADAPGVALSPRSLAYIFYTSGSTGRPKGVVDNHRNVLHNVMRYTNRLGISPGDRLSLLQAPSFSGTVSTLFAGLLNGASVHPCDLASRGISGLADTVSDGAVTIYHSVPAIFRSLCATGRRFPSVRVVRLEGDQASARDLDLFNRHFEPPCVLANGLGLTETGLVRQLILPHGASVEGSRLPVGEAIVDMAIEIHGPDGRPLPDGEAGAIAVTSRYLALGYWREPSLTRTAFPRAGPPDAGRAYRSADLGRLGPDGCLEYLGRLDTRIKLHGKWVPLGDIEEALMKQPFVEDAAVAVRADASGTDRLVAWYVPAGGTVPPPDELRALLTSALPAELVPSRFVRIAALPLTAAGKVDRAALPEPGADRPDLATPYRPPSNMLEDQLVGIWEEVLGVAPAGVDDHFLDLGGDSLLAENLVLAVEESFGRPFPRRVLLETSTVAELARALDREMADGAADLPERPAVGLKPDGGLAPFFFLHGDYLSGGYFSQRIARGIDPDRPFYVLTPLPPSRSPAANSAEAHARRYLGEIRRIQPRGPYFVGGNCNGGVIALEIAQQLRAAGDDVGTLVLVRTPPTGLRSRRLYLSCARIAGLLRLPPDLRHALLRRLRWYLQDFEARSGRERLNFVAGRAVRPFAVLAGRLRARGKPRPAAPDTGADTAPASAGNDVDEVFMDLVADYVPRDYPGRVALFWPREDALAPAVALDGWTELCPAVELHELPGDHISCLTRHGARFAERLNEVLGSVRRPGAIPAGGQEPPLEARSAPESPSV